MCRMARKAFTKSIDFIVRAAGFDLHVIRYLGATRRLGGIFRDIGFVLVDRRYPVAARRVDCIVNMEATHKVRLRNMKWIQKVDSLLDLDRNGYEDD